MATNLLFGRHISYTTKCYAHRTQEQNNQTSRTSAAMNYNEISVYFL